MIIENSLAGSSKRNGVVERTIQSVQRMRRTIRSAIEEKREVTINVTHSVLPWIAEQTRLKGKSLEGILWKRRRAGGALGKLTCMWEEGVYLGIKANTREVTVENRKGVWLTRTVWRQTAGERWEHSNLEMIVAVP